jgi:tetratricopeptide (TPR) repeat protein
MRHRFALFPLTALACLVVTLLASPQAHAAPRTPTDDQEVVERLPARLPGAAPRARATAKPPRQADLALALLQAREAIGQARRSGDPRDWGRAQALLTPWWALTEPPAAVRLLRATIRQAQHDFAEALADLDALLDPRRPAAALPLQAQAELTRAALHQVQGRYALARQGCERLAGAAYAPLGDSVALPAKACVAELDHLQGRRTARQADAQLARLGPADDAWLALLRAELAQRAGRATQAEALFRAATAGRAPSLYALAAHADWLLEQGRSAEVTTLLAGYEEVDALLLRLAIARHGPARPGAPARGEDITALQVRFDAALARGDRGHAREQARFALDLLGDARQALALAEANWARQREPADALLLLRAATAAGQPQAAEHVHRWAREQGFVDARWSRIGPPTARSESGS